MRRTFYAGRQLSGRVVSLSSLMMAKNLSPRIIRQGDDSVSGSTVWEGDEIHFCESPREAFLTFLRINNNILIDKDL